MSKIDVWTKYFQIILFICLGGKAAYLPTWDSLDTRPLPQWYDDAKIGIFIHWGLYSVPAFGSEWFWYYLNTNHSAYVNFMNKNFPNSKYGDFTSKFTARNFNPAHWAQIFRKAGARYVVLTSKHHEGFTMWPSKYSWMWNSFDVGPHRDIVGELADAVRAEDLTFGLYHSLFEWFHPLFLFDEENNFNTSVFVSGKTLPELYELVEKYSPEIIWSDGEWSANDNYWQSKEFIAYLYNDSPVKDTVVVNDRWGVNTSCKHGDFWNCADRFKPGSLLQHKWENAMTLDKSSWGYRNDMSVDDVLSIEDLIAEMVETVSLGGNILINVGPTSDGIIPVIFEERLEQLGEWLHTNGESIYKTRPWNQSQHDVLNENVWYTAQSDTIYAICLVWPKNNSLILGSVKPKGPLFITLLGCDVVYSWVVIDSKLNIDIGSTPAYCLNKLKWAWVFRIQK